MALAHPDNNTCPICLINDATEFTECFHHFSRDFINRNDLRDVNLINDNNYVIINNNRNIINNRNIDNNERHQENIENIINNRDLINNFLYVRINTFRDRIGDFMRYNIVDNNIINDIMDFD